MSNHRKVQLEETVFERVVLKHFPQRFKRMIYVSSIFGLIHNVNNPDEELIRKLNDTIHLAHDSKTCELPIYMREAIWKKADLQKLHLSGDTAETISLTEVVKHQLSTDDCVAIGRQIATNTPNWLRYDSLEVMINDVVLLIKQLKNIYINVRFKPDTHMAY